MTWRCAFALLPARALTLGLILLGASGAACAHAVLVASEPADGAVFERAPVEVVVRFNEPVTPAAVRLVDATGARLPAEAVVIGGGSAFRVPLPVVLGDGRHVLSYRVTSADGHPVAGAVAFVVGREIADTPVAGERMQVVDASARIALRVVHDLAWMLAMGGAIYLLLVAPFPQSRGLLLGACAIVAITACLGAGLHGMALQDDDAGLFDRATWMVGLRSPRGTSAMLAVVGAGLVAFDTVLGKPGRRRWWLASGIAMLMASALVTGHVATASPRALAATAMSIHVLGAAFWSGSLVALGLTLVMAPTPASIRALQRFSRIAIVAVPMFVVAGATLAIFQLEAPGDLLETNYGRWILAKGALLLALLVVAAANRWRWMPLLVAGDPGSMAALRRNIAIEIALVACAVAAAAMLAQTPPARVLPSTGFVHLVLAERDVRVHFTLDPGRPGPNAITLQFESAAGVAIEPAEVRLEFEQTAAGIGPIVRTVARTAPGTYTWRGNDLALPGEWTVAIHARIGDFEQVTFRTQVPL